MTLRKLLLALGLALGLLNPALAVVPGTYIGNANYTLLATDHYLIATTALTATRTLTLTSAGATCVGIGSCGTALTIADPQGDVGGANSCYSIAPASGETINGSTSAVTWCGTYGHYTLIPLSGSTWIGYSLSNGQTGGTVTNDNASPGNVGEVITSGLCTGSANTATITVTIAAPAVVSWTTHGYTGACPVVFTTTGALPTGLTAGTTYYVVPSSITTGTFQVATTVANALAGTSITTTGTQSGTQTGTGGVAMTTTTAATVTGVVLTPGDWDCRAKNAHVLGASTSVTKLTASIATTPTTAGSQGIDGVTILSTAANVMGAAGTDLVIEPYRVSLAAATNYYLVEQDTFTVSTDIGFGTLTCRRAR